MPRKRKAPGSAEPPPTTTPADKRSSSDGSVSGGGGTRPTTSTSTTPAAPFTALPLRYVCRLIEPGPILLVSTGRVADGSHNLMTLGFHMMVQHEGPTLVGVCLGPWDASFARLRAQKQCVLAVPSAEMAGAVVDIGNVSAADFEHGGGSGSDTHDENDEHDGNDINDAAAAVPPANKWERFGLTPQPATAVQPPLVGGPHIMANLECVVHDRQLVGRFNLWVLRVVRAWWDEERVQRTGRMLHHRGNGVFAVSGGEAAGAVVDLHERMTKWSELE